MNWKDRAKLRDLAENPPVAKAPKAVKPKVEVVEPETKSPAKDK